MARRTRTVLVATDGSPQARAAVTAAAGFPWPRGTGARGVIARDVPSAAAWSPALWDTLERALRREARRAQRVLRQRWPNADVVLVDAPPVAGILGEARRRRVTALVLGSRGHGPLGRLVLGSVSLGVVRRAPCPVLVVKRRLHRARRLVVGIDGSAPARRAAAFVAGLDRPQGGRVTLVAVVEPSRPPAMGLLPRAVRAALQEEMRALETGRLRTARREVDAAASRLTRTGWRVRAEVVIGLPLPGLLARVQAARGEVLVVGARGVGGLTRLLLGSVVEGALTRSPVSVLVVR